MTEDEAYLMARMQAALVDEGVLHHPDRTGQPPVGLVEDEAIIVEAVRLAWPRLAEYQRLSLRAWSPAHNPT